MKLKLAGIIFTIFVYVPLVVTGMFALYGLRGTGHGISATTEAVSNGAVCRSDAGPCSACGDAGDRTDVFNDIFG